MDYSSRKIVVLVLHVGIVEYTYIAANKAHYHLELTYRTEIFISLKANEWNTIFRKSS